MKTEKEWVNQIQMIFESKNVETDSIILNIKKLSRLEKKKLFRNTLKTMDFIQFHPIHTSNQEYLSYVLILLVLEKEISGEKETVKMTSLFEKIKKKYQRIANLCTITE